MKIKSKIKQPIFKTEGNIKMRLSIRTLCYLNLLITLNILITLIDYIINTASFTSYILTNKFIIIPISIIITIKKSNLFQFPKK